MNTLLTAEETFYKFTGCVINHKDVKIAMIEFAKLHVRHALKQASKKSKRREGTITDYKLTNSVLTAYKLENIK